MCRLVLVLVSIVVTCLFIVESSFALTLKNATNIVQKHVVDGRVISAVNPGDTLETPFYPDSGTNLTITAHTPYFNRITASTTVSAVATPGVTVVLQAETKYIGVFSITGSVSVYKQTEANIPPELTTWTSDEPSFLIPVDNRFTQVIIIGSGTCQLVEYNSWTY